MPILVTLCGIILFFQPFTAKDVLTMFFGGCLAVYGIEELTASWILRKVKFGRDGKFVNAQANIQDVPFEEVDSPQK